MPARAASPESDRPSRKSYGAKKGRTSTAKELSPEPELEQSDQEMVADDGGEDEEDEEEEEEFEIEAILGDDVGTFPDGRTGYFVKWKGYSNSQNSWVDELDAGNARSLIDAYWRVKRVTNKKSQTKEGRKSVGKPRGRESKPEEPSESEGGHEEDAGKEVDDDEEDAGKEVDDDEEEVVPVKRSRASITASASVKKKPVAKAAPKPAPKAVKAKIKAEKNPTVEAEEDEMDVDEERTIDMFETYKQHKSWEKLVESVETVERTEGDELMVYFKTVSGERAMQLSTICKAKFPQKLLEFYESNLRWKHTEAEAE